MLAKRVMLAAAVVLVAACSTPTAPNAGQSPHTPVADEAAVPPAQTNSNGGNLFGSGT